MSANKNSESNVLWIIVGLIVVLMIGGLFLLASSGKKKQKKADRELLESGIRNVKGNPEAEIVIVEFSNYQCSACKTFNDVLVQAASEYGDQIAAAFRHYPFSNEGVAHQAALAVEAAGVQGKSWELTDIFFERQEEWGSLSTEEFLLKLREYAEEIGIEDIDTFVSDVESATYAANVDGDLEIVDELGLTGTPTVYINGEFFEEFSSYEALKEEIEKRL